MSQTILKTRLKNLVVAEGGADYEYYLSNIAINGRKVGCSGFIKNPRTNLILYVNTEGSSYQPLADKIMYRYAKDLNDYTGGSNKWAKKEDIGEDLVFLLEHPIAENDIPF